MGPRLFSYWLVMSATAFTPAMMHGAEFVRADANADGALNLADPISMLTYLFAGGRMDCLDAADVNDDGAVNIGDPIYCLSYLFASGPVPPPPFPDCGEDPTADGLGCVAFAACPQNKPPAPSFTVRQWGLDTPLQVAFDASLSADPDGTIVGYAWDFGDGATGSGVRVTHTYARADTFAVTLTVTDDGGALASVTKTIAVSHEVLPPDPSELAPPLDGTVATDFVTTVEFIYAGDSPLQTDMAPGAIDARRLAVIRGRVLARDGEPLGGVRIAILRHPELGGTLSRADGFFDVAVNGGGRLTVEYTKGGYLTAQRQVDTPWCDFAWVPDVILVPLDERVTEIDFSEPLQTARGSPETDAAGTRQMTLLFPDDAGPRMVMGDGEVVSLDRLHVRVTEYTVGPNGPDAMPAELPPAVAYTYCAELSVDEAMAAGATTVQFDKPVITYLENFLDVPVGMIVPVGLYDRSQGVWVPSENGLVIAIVAESGGTVDLDIDGDGEPDDAQALAELGITDTERQRLADLYEPGQTLWRCELRHFSPLDCNFPNSLGDIADDAEAPDDPEPDDGGPGDEADPCRDDGRSTVNIHDRSLGESVAVLGTPFRLHYQSDRVLGSPAFTIDIPVSRDSLPDSLISMALIVDVAGQRHGYTFPPQANLTKRFTWDGLDGYGRRVQGPVRARIRLGYTYPVMYVTGPSWANLSRVFGRRPGAVGMVVLAPSVAAPPTITLWTEWDGRLGGLQAEPLGLGGWTLNAHHFYAGGHQMLYRGDGLTVHGERTNLRAEPVAGLCTIHDLNDGIPALEACLINAISDIAVGPDGSYYLTTTGANQLVRRVDPDGIITIVAGGGPSSDDLGDGGPATEAHLAQPSAVAVGSDGSIYIADAFHSRIRRVSPDGIISTVAGTGTVGYAGDGGPAIDAQLGRVLEDVVSAPDGGFYFIDGTRVRHVGTDGIITRVAGCSVSPCLTPDVGGPATDVSLNPMELALAPDGVLYIADRNYGVVRVAPDGWLTGLTLPSSAPECAGGLVFHEGIALSEACLGVLFYGMALAPDGSLFISTYPPRCDDQSRSRIFRIWPDGLVTSWVGNARKTSGELSRGGSLVTDFAFLCGYVPQALAVGPDGVLLFSMFRWPGDIVGRVSHGEAEAIGEQHIASEDGSRLFVFDRTGRHMRTLDALSGVAIHRFAYDTEGRLAAIEERNGNVTRIERGHAGAPIVIVAPDGRQTTLDVGDDGYLSSIVDSGGRSVGMTYVAGGRLTTFTDSNGATHTFSYDSLGHLEEDRDAEGGSLHLSRARLPGGYEIEATTAEGRVSTYRVEAPSEQHVHRIQTDPSGNRITTITDPAGTRRIEFPDGTVVERSQQVDPLYRFPPILSALSISTPGGRRMVQALTRSVTLADSADPLSLTRIEERLDINGRVFLWEYQADAGTARFVSPELTVQELRYDALGRMVHVAYGAGLDPVAILHDEGGRVARETQGDQYWEYGRDGLGRVVSMTNASGESVGYGYDGADRLIRLTLPSGKTYGFSHDGRGNRTAITLPSGSIHGFEYTAFGAMRTYTPPGTSSYHAEFNGDRQPIRVTLPGGRVKSYQYAAGGSLERIVVPEADVVFAYEGTPTPCCGGAGSPLTITRLPAGGGDAQHLRMEYDGSLPTSLAFLGPASGTYAYEYDDNFFLTRMVFDEDLAISIAYDRNGNVTQFGSFTFGRGGPARKLDRIGDSVAAIGYGYDGLGRIVTRTLTVNGVAVHSLTIERDRAGYVTRRVQAKAGSVETLDYIYDEDGQLASARRAGEEIESYAYDANRNRILRCVGSGAAETATYDAADRITQNGDVACQVDDDGHLVTRGADTFRYSARGELLEAELGAGPTIRYIYDGLVRRVARVGPEGTHQYLYGYPDAPFTVSAVRDPAGVLTIPYYDEEGLLYAFDRGDTRYYVGVDQVGTPQVVADATGTIVKTLSFDSYGVLLDDSNPGFELPFGFAGGLVDPATRIERFGLRDYDPALGRWTARDPLLFAGGIQHLFAYAGNNPVNQRDSTGLFCWGVSGYAGGGGQITMCYTRQGTAICVEGGVGIGGGLNIQPFGDLPREGVYFEGEFTAGVGPLQVGGGGRYDDCGFAPEWRCQAGPINLCEGKVEASHEQLGDAARRGWRDLLSALQNRARRGASDTRLSARLEGKVVMGYCHVFDFGNL